MTCRSLEAQAAGDCHILKMTTVIYLLRIFIQVLPGHGECIFQSHWHWACHVSGAKPRKPLALADKAHVLQAAICRSMDLEGWMQQVFKRGPSHYLNRVSSYSEEKKDFFSPHTMVSLTVEGPVSRQWFIWSEGHIVQLRGHVGQLR